jgi:hypothetical protein
MSPISLTDQSPNSSECAAIGKKGEATCPYFSKRGSGWLVIQGQGVSTSVSSTRSRVASGWLMTRRCCGSVRGTLISKVSAQKEFGS